MDLSNVDFPHPEGPMSAVTERGGTAIETFLSACFFPYQKEKSASFDGAVQIAIRPERIHVIAGDRGA